ncbi:hypothetical protein [Xanthomonas theicola]|nr:hypothetical protein [Xanthomonas theicola]
MFFRNPGSVVNDLLERKVAEIAEQHPTQYTTAGEPAKDPQ